MDSRILLSLAKCLILCVLPVFTSHISHASQLVHTIQLSSFTHADEAEKYFDAVEHQLHHMARDYLRIEKVGKYYAVRTGNYGNYNEATLSLDAISNQVPSAIIIKAYIIDERTVKKLTEELLPEEEGLTASTMPFDVTPPLPARKSPTRPVHISADDYISLPPDEKPELFGVIITNGDNSALINDRFSGQTRIYRVNDEVGGFTVREIREDVVILAINDKFVEIRLRAHKDIPPLYEEVVHAEPAPVQVHDLRKPPENRSTDRQLDW
jgi:hypothetical protein